MKRSIRKEMSDENKNSAEKSLIEQAREKISKIWCVEWSCSETPIYTPKSSIKLRDEALALLDQVRQLQVCPICGGSKTIINREGCSYCRFGFVENGNAGGHSGIRFYPCPKCSHTCSDCDDGTLVSYLRKQITEKEKIDDEEVSLRNKVTCELIKAEQQIEKLRTMIKEIGGIACDTCGVSQNCNELDKCPVKTALAEAKSFDAPPDKSEKENPK